MKRFSIFLAVLIVLAFTVVPAFAAEAGTESTESPVTVNTPVSVVIEDNEPIVVVYTDAGSAVRSQLSAAIEAIFGKYTPLTQTVTTYLDDGTTIDSIQVVPGVAGMDWVWISGVVLFALTLYCIFRMIGGIFRWK